MVLGRSGPLIFATLALLSLLACSGNDAPSTLAEASPFAAEVADAVANGDTERLVGLVELQTVACATVVEGAGGPPQCGDGDADGSEYRVFPAAVCEGFWTRDPESVMASFANAGEPYALAELGAPPDWAVDFPYGKQILIFSPTPDGPVIGAMALYLEGERIVRAQNGCRRAGQFLEPGVDEETPAVLWRAAP